MQRFGIADRGADARLWVVRGCTGAALAYVALTCALILGDQIRQLPPREPTPDERARATPAALAQWGRVRPQIVGRLTYRPAEFGAVWQSRSGRTCGTVTRLNAGVYYRTRFYTERGEPRFAADDERRFVRAWLDCVGDHWVDLKVDSDAVGFCAVPRNQVSVIAAVLCRRE